MTLCPLCHAHEAETTEVMGIKTTLCPKVPKGTAYATSGDPYETFQRIAKGPQQFEEGIGTDEGYESAVKSVVKITGLVDNE